MKILAIDLGDARTGLAVCDPLEMLASPLEVVTQYNRDKLAEHIARTVQAQGAELVVMGHPINMNGTLGPRSELVKEFAQKLEPLLSVPLVLWDERSTTVSATHILNETNVRGQKRKAVIDAVAAVIILENYLRFRKNQSKQPQ